MYISIQSMEPLVLKRILKRILDSQSDGNQTFLCLLVLEWGTKILLLIKSAVFLFVVGSKRFVERKE